MIQEDIAYIERICKEFNIPEYEYHPHIKKGPTNIKTHTFPITIKYYEDHLGYHYATLLDMCNAYNISVETFHKRKARKMPLDKILTTKEKPKQKRVVPKIDHTGKEFKTAKEMCEAWGTTASAVYHRMTNLGWSLEKALTNHWKAPITDHLGIKHFGKDAMLKAYDITYPSWFSAYGTPYESFDEKIERGLSLGEALIKDQFLYDSIPNELLLIMDHTGKTYDSVENMCAAYNTNIHRYMYLIKIGYSLKEALTEKNVDIEHQQTIGLGLTVRIDNKPETYKVITNPYEAIGTTVVGLEGFGPCPIERLQIINSKNT